MMLDQLIQVAAAACEIRRRWNGRPTAGIVLGTGLGRLADEIAVEAEFPYEAIPHFPRSRAPGHRGRLLCGTLAGRSIVAMDGRVHLYEGYTAGEAAFGVRLMAALGVELLLVTNACGGMNRNFRSGDLMVIEDHVNLTFDNPLVGRHDSTSELKYPDLSCPYDRELTERAMEIARQSDFVMHRGVYLGVPGPNYETRAEYRFFHRIGCDGVGMSTVPEVIVAVQCGVRVLALSVVTNVCFPDGLRPADGQEVIAVAASAEPKVRAVILGVLAQQD